MRRAALSIGVALTSAPALPHAPAQAGEVAIAVSNVEPGAGTVYAGLCQGALETAACRPGDARPAAADTVRLTIPDVAPGTYAAVVFQDVNANGRLDKNIVGYPKEPYAISNIPSGFPTFGKASFALNGKRAAIAVRLRRPD